MINLKKNSQMLAVTALILAFSQASAISTPETSAELHCRKACTQYTNPALFPCFKENGCFDDTRVRGNLCKERCVQQHPSPKYDACKKECLEKPEHKDSTKRNMR